MPGKLALAELAVARQNRLREEEEKELVSARGAKDVEAKRRQTERTTEAETETETEKQLTLINVERENVGPRAASKPPSCFVTRPRSTPRPPRSPPTRNPMHARPPSTPTAPWTSRRPE